jgi:hypothetical protein
MRWLYTPGSLGTKQEDGSNEPSRKYSVYTSSPEPRNQNKIGRGHCLKDIVFLNLGWLLVAIRQSVHTGPETSIFE